MWKVIIISGSGQQKLEAKTKRECHKLIPWTRLSSIQKLPGRIYLVRVNG